MVVTPLHAEDAASNHAPAASDFLGLRMNDTIPFLSHGDGLNEALKQSRAIVMVLASAFRTAREASDFPEVDTIKNLNPIIVSNALEGVATLIALAQHHYDQVRA